MKTKTQIADELQNAMTAAQLIERLQECDPDAPVLFTCNYGDYGRTMQALPIAEIDEYLSTDISASAYSHSGMAFQDEEEGFDGTWCPKCEAERSGAICPKCKEHCFNEDGTLATYADDDDESFAVVILQ